MPGDYSGLLALLFLSSVFAVLVIGVGAVLGAAAGRSGEASPPPAAEPAALDTRLRLVRVALIFACALPAIALALLWLPEARSLGSAALPGVLGLGVPVSVGLWAAFARGAVRW